jgi:hypothetical protein
MEYEPTLSIITVSAFDHDRLTVTLNSLIGASASIEQIVVTPEDDFESQAIVDRLKKSEINRITLLHDQQKGVYPAMNIGAMAAKGKYICFWNAGDKLNDKEELKVLLENLNSLSPKWAICQGKFEWRKKQELTFSNLYEFVTHKPNAFISHQTVIIKKDTFKEIGMFDCRYRVASDTAQITKLFFMDPPHFNHAIVVRVETPNFASRYHRRARIEVFLIALRNLFGRHKIRALVNIFRNEIFRMRHKFE